MEKTKRNRIAAITVGALVIAGVLGGGGAALASVSQARSDAAAHAEQVKQEAQEQHEIETRMYAAAADAKDEQDAAAEVDYQKFLADKAAAEAKAAADAAKAAEDARIAAEAQQAAQQAQAKKSTTTPPSGGWSTNNLDGGDAGKQEVAQNCGAAGASVAPDGSIVCAG